MIEAATKGGLTVALWMLVRVLRRDSMSGYLLYSGRFSDVERRVALYAYPLLDPQMHMLVEGDEALRAELLEGVKSRGTDANGLVKALQIPANVALSAVWGLLRKLVMQPVVPYRAMIDQFAREESHNNDVLRAELTRLREQRTDLHNRRGGLAVNVLALVFLRYRGSPANSDEDSSSPADTMRTLAENEYVVGEEARPPDVALLEAVVSRARADLIDRLGQRVDAGEIAFAGDWRASVLPDGSPAKGSLLPKPVDAAEGAEK